MWPHLLSDILQLTWRHKQVEAVFWVMLSEDCHASWQEVTLWNRPNTTVVNSCSLPLIRMTQHYMNCFNTFFHTHAGQTLLHLFFFHQNQTFSSSHFLSHRKRKTKFASYKLLKNDSKIGGKAVQISKEKFHSSSGLFCAVNYSSFLNSHYLFTHDKLAE